MSEQDYDTVATRGAKIVWSPRSNVFLYGKTLNVTYLLEAGITVALGTDWLPSGSATMQREAVCAASVTKESYGIQLGARALWEMMTINAARVAGFERELGSLEVGKVADIAVFSRGSGDEYSRAVYARGADVELVMRGGQILLASGGLQPEETNECELLHVGHTRKLVCVATELGSSFGDFEASLQGVYPAFYPVEPPDEPTCKPTR